MADIGFVTHVERAAATDLAAHATAWLRPLGHRARLVDADTARDVIAGLDLAVSLGGDGTMLRTVNLVCAAKVPVLGVNLGHLGYLTAVEPDGLDDALRRFIAGEYRVDERMTIDVAVVDGAAVAGDGMVPVLRRTALNDVLLQRPGGGHTIRVALEVNGAHFLSFAADSVIIATPTGSTAYNLSARGPIVSPRARVQVVTPVAPHSLFDRSLILDASEEIAIRPVDDRAADLVVDGVGLGVVKPGQVIRCTAGALDARLVTFGDRDFQDILKQKFNLDPR
jgi:NAD+ kinase